MTANHCVARTLFWCYSLFAAVLFSFSAAAYTVPPTAPTWSTNGNYTVSFQAYTCYWGSSCVSYWLEERVGPSGSWTQVTGYSATSVTYTAKPQNSYSYRLVHRINVGGYVQNASTEI